MIDKKAPGTMDFIKWKEAYSVKVEEIDAQHKKLIGLINQMADAMSIGRGRDVLSTVLTELYGVSFQYGRAALSAIRLSGI